MTDLKEKLPFSKHKRKKKEEMLRIEELQKLLEETGGDVDPETVVSLYMPHRRRKLFADAILRLDKMSLWLIALLAVIGILFIAAFAQEKMGNFTINLNRLELYRKGIAISDDPYFTRPTARLIANTVADATNISIDDLPDDLDEVSGGHNGDNYMAYTYYVRNAGKEDVWYNARITLDSCAKGAEEAVRVAVWHNGTRTVYACPPPTASPRRAVSALPTTRPSAPTGRKTSWWETWINIPSSSGWKGTTRSAWTRSSAAPWSLPCALTRTTMTIPTCLPSSSGILWTP